MEQGKEVQPQLGTQPEEFCMMRKQGRLLYRCCQRSISQLWGKLDSTSLWSWEFCSSKTVDVQEYRKLCETLYLLYLQCFPSPKKNQDTWIRITPSLHKLLGHSWELIEHNDDSRLKNFDESGLEANNKILRSIRLKLARKTSQTANLTHVIHRLWLGSDPKVNHIRLHTQPYCKHCNEHGHSTRYCKVRSPALGPLTSDDSLFNSLVI